MVVPDLDNATAGLAAMIREAKAQGTAIVGIFHDIDIRDTVADRLFAVTQLQDAA